VCVYEYSTRSLVELFEESCGRFVLVKDTIQVFLMRLLLSGEFQVLLRDFPVELSEKYNSMRQRSVDLRSRVANRLKRELIALANLDKKPS